MKKLILCILFIFIIPVCILFTGCGGTQKANDYSKSQNDRFLLIKEYKDGVDTYIILVDKETRVLYLRYSESYRAGLTVMLDANGNPLLYEGQLDE